MAQYKKDVYAVVETDQSMIGSAESSMHAKFEIAMADHTNNMKKVHEAKRQGLINKAMLLQTGQDSNWYS